MTLNAEEERGRLNQRCATAAYEVELPLVDAHHHLWDYSVRRYAWQLGTNEECDTPSYVVDDYLADIASQSVEMSVHVEGNWDPHDPVAETSLLQSIADEHHFPHAIIGYAALQEPSVAETLDRHLEHHNFRGIRQMLNWDPDPLLRQCDRSDYLQQEAWRRGFRELGRRNLSFDLQAFPWQAVQVAVVAREFETVPIVINHIGMHVRRGPAGWETWRRSIELLGSCPNTTIKISGMSMHNPASTAQTIGPELDVVLESFGSQRCMVGSNFPVDGRWRSYADVAAGLRLAVSALSTSEQRDILSETARRIYRL